MGWKAGNMPMESFDITVLGEDGTYHKIGLDKVKVIKEE